MLNKKMPAKYAITMLVLMLVIIQQVAALSAAPVVTDVQISPSNPGIDREITITASASDSDGDVVSMSIWYKVFSGGYGGTLTEGVMTQNGNTWTGRIPAQSMEGEVEFYIEATDDTGETGRSATQTIEITAGTGVGGGLGVLLPVAAIAVLLVVGVAVIFFIVKRR